MYRMSLLLILQSSPSFLPGVPRPQNGAVRYGARFEPVSGMGLQERWRSVPGGYRPPSASVLSSPQAAWMSSPREARIVVWMPRAVSASRKRRIASSSGEK